MNTTSVMKLRTERTQRFLGGYMPGRRWTADMVTEEPTTVSGQFARVMCQRWPTDEFAIYDSVAGCMALRISREYAIRIIRQVQRLKGRVKLSRHAGGPHWFGGHVSIGDILVIEEPAGLDYKF